MELAIKDKIFNVFIFGRQNTRAGEYGLGSYLKELANCMKFYNNVKLHFVYIESKIHKELTVDTENGITSIYVPAPLYTNPLHDKYYNIKLYAKRITDLMFDFVSGKENLIFQFNLSAEFFLAKEIKKRFNGKIIYVVHCFMWYFDFYGNEKKFKEWEENNLQKENTP